MNNDFRNKILQPSINSNLMNNPMEMLNDKHFKEIFSETLKMLQENN